MQKIAALSDPAFVLGTKTLTEVISNGVVEGVSFESVDHQQLKNDRPNHFGYRGLLQLFQRHRVHASAIMQPRRPVCSRRQGCAQQNLLMRWPSIHARLLTYPGHRQGKQARLLA